jgi:hypothetical protein
MMRWPTPAPRSTGSVLPLRKNCLQGQAAMQKAPVINSYDSCYKHAATPMMRCPTPAPRSTGSVLPLRKKLPARPDSNEESKL